MKTLKIYVDMKDQHITTEGMTTMKGNVDGTVSFEEAGINEEIANEKDEIEQHFIERHADYNVEVIFQYKKFKDVLEYASHLINNYGKKMIENNLEVKLPETFSDMEYEEKISYLIMNHSADLEDDMMYYNENVE